MATLNPRGGLHLQHLSQQRVPTLLQKLDVLFRLEEDPALTLATAPPAATALRSTPRRHSRPWRRARGSKQCCELQVAIPYGISSLLLGQDVVQPLLRSREQGLWP